LVRKLDNWLRETGGLKKEVSHALIGKYVYLHYLRDRDILSNARLAEWKLDESAICLGSAVENAAKHEEKCSAGQIGVSKRIFDALPERLSKHFTYDGDIACYVAKDLTADKVERAAKASAAAGAPAFITSTGSGVTITEREREGARTIIPGRSYADG
jgi:hypothetical protein